MLNNPVLPALFLASGTSSGIAATFLFILIAGKLKGDSHESHFIHKFEVPIMVTELGLLICFFVGLHFGGGQKVVALHNALSGFWGAVFWIGVFLIGIIIPLLANLAVKDNLKYNKNFIILVSIFDLIGGSLLTLLHLVCRTTYRCVRINFLFNQKAYTIRLFVYLED